MKSGLAHFVYLFPSTSINGLSTSPSMTVRSGVVPPEETGVELLGFEVAAAVGLAVVKGITVSAGFGVTLGIGAGVAAGLGVAFGTVFSHS
jgi:hypothetical protein